MKESGGGEPSVSSVRRRHIITLLLSALAFAIAYSQSPLFTSNQNQYFLHGLARSGFGFLRQDWLANTLDPTPVFTYLVSLLYTVFQFPAFFYLVYLVLLGLYFLTCFGIARIVAFMDYPLARLIFIVLFTLVHSAAFRFALSHGTSPDWSYIFEGGLAGQRILGTVFQPSSFGILLLVSIYIYLLRKYFFAAVLAIISAAVHPTYLLPAAMLIGAYMWGYYRDGKLVSRVVWLGLFALLLALPIVAYVLVTFWPSSPQEYARSQQLLVSFRLPHHASISEWLDGSSIFQILFVILAAFLTRKTTLFPVFGIGIAAGALITSIQLLSGSNALALLFPWRISSVLVPLSTTVLLAFLVEYVFKRWNVWLVAHTALLSILGLVIILLAMVAGISYFTQEREDKLNSPETALFEYVKQNKLSGEIYLTPIDLQDFRLASGAPAYIDFKSIPYQDLEVLEWHRRVLLASNFYRKNRIDCGELREWFLQEDLSHLIITSEQREPDCQILNEVYHNENYRLFRFTE